MKLFAGIAIVGMLLVAGCLREGDFTILGGGIGKDVIARVYQELGRDTLSVDNEYAHKGYTCDPPMKWSIQWRNDHPTDQNEMKYGVPYNDTLITSLQQWADQNTVLRFYWVRYVDTRCQFTDNEVVYCAEPADYSIADSKREGCIADMGRTFPGLQATWNQGK